MAAVMVASPLSGCTDVAANGGTGRRRALRERSWHSASGSDSRPPRSSGVRVSESRGVQGETVTQPAADAALGVSSPAVSIVCHVRQTARLDSTARSSAVESAPCRTDGVPS